VGKCALQTDERELRGLAILAQGSQIIRLSGLKYKVRSRSGNGSYFVSMNNFHEWTCECPDYAFRHVTCKHIHAVKFSLGLRQRITSENLGIPILGSEAEICKFCGSTDLIRRGFNNRMERLNQTFRDRNKTQRGLDSRSSAQEMSEAIRVAYNFIRPHTALNGKTPAETAGIDLQLEDNRWKSLIEQASRTKVPRPNAKASSS